MGGWLSSAEEAGAAETTPREAVRERKVSRGSESPSAAAQGPKSRDATAGEVLEYCTAAATRLENLLEAWEAGRVPRGAPPAQPAVSSKKKGKKKKGGKGGGGGPPMKIKPVVPLVGEPDAGADAERKAAFVDVKVTHLMTALDAIDLASDDSKRSKRRAILRRLDTVAAAARAWAAHKKHVAEVPDVVGAGAAGAAGATTAHDEASFEDAEWSVVESKSKPRKEDDAEEESSAPVTPVEAPKPKKKGKKDKASAAAAAMHAAAPVAAPVEEAPAPAPEPVTRVAPVSSATWKDAIEAGEAACAQAAAIALDLGAETAESRTTGAHDKGLAQPIPIFA